MLHQLRVVDHLLFTHLALGFERFRTHAELGLLILACVLFGVAFLRDSLCGTANHVDGWMDEVGWIGDDGGGVALGGVRDRGRGGGWCRVRSQVKFLFVFTLGISTDMYS